MSTPDDNGQAARLDRVRKLLAKAERAGTPDEAEVYTAKAVELMARHGIDDAVLAASDPRRVDEIGGTRIEIDDPYSGGKARLLGWTASALRCRWIMHNAHRGKVPAVTIFGFESDRARAQMLYTSLLLQIARPMRDLRDPGLYPGDSDSPSSTAAYRRSWLYGFAARIHERLVAAEAKAVRETEPAAGADSGSGAAGAALVLASRADQVDRAHAEAFPELRTSRPPRISGGAYHEGAAAADRVDLGTTGEVGEQSRRALQQ